MKKILSFVITALMLIQSSSLVFAEEDDLEVFGLEVEKLLNLGSGLLAIGLFIVTFIAYRKTKRKRLIYVNTAFLLFAIKGFLESTEIFFGDLSWVDSTASVLNFAILLTFFAGVLKK